jgi:phosphate/sulfate permease
MRLNKIKNSLSYFKELIIGVLGLIQITLITLTAVGNIEVVNLWIFTPLYVMLIGYLFYLIISLILYRREERL